MNKKSHIVSVAIFNRQYAIRTDEKTEYIDNLAKELDQLLHSASRKGKFSEIEMMTLVMLQFMDKHKKLEKDYESLIEVAKKMELGSKNK